MKTTIVASEFFIFKLFLKPWLYKHFGNSNSQVKQWAEEKKIANFKAERMESTKFIDLSVKLGFPYLYTHLGDCEHLLLFTSLK